MSSAPRRRAIGAHELGSYLYCPRAWWYEQQPGLPALEGEGRGEDTFRRGREVHALLETRHSRAQYASRAPYAVAAAAGILLLGALALWWFHYWPF